MNTVHHRQEGQEQFAALVHGATDSQIEHMVMAFKNSDSGDAHTAIKVCLTEYEQRHGAEDTDAFMDSIGL